MLKKLNIPLIIGLVLLVVILLMALFPDTFAPVDPYGREGFKITHQADGRLGMERPPFKPGQRGILGTDELGRDILSQVIYGTRNTLVIVFFAVLFRFLLAFPFGIAAGFGLKTSGWLIKIMNTIFTTLPALIFSMIVLKLPFFKAMPPEYSTIAFAAVISMVEWARLAQQIELQVKEILKQPYIEGAVALGKSRFQIAISNVVPHLVPYLLVFLSLEAARAMFILCQLGVFDVVMGNLSFDRETLLDYAGRNVAYEPEWAGMLGTSVRTFTTYPWVVFPPMTAFFAGILSFNLVGEGLRFEFEKRNSRFISGLKKLVYVISPRLYIYDVKNIRKKPAPAIIRIGTTILLVGLIFFPKGLFYHPFDGTAAMVEIKNLESDKYDGRLTGTKGRDKASEYIAGELEKLGFKPGGKNGSYMYDFSIPSLNLVRKQEISFREPGKDWITLVPGKDFRLLNYGMGFIEETLHFPAADAKNGNYNSGSVSVIKTEYANKTGTSYLFAKHEAYREAIKYLDRSKVIFITSDLTKLEKLPNEPSWIQQFSIPFIEIKKETADLLISGRDIEIKLEILSGQDFKVNGRNIIGVLEGKDRVVKDNFILVGIPYSGTGNEGTEGIDGAAGSGTSAALGLQLARSLVLKGQPKKTVILAFWDNADRENSGGYIFSNDPSGGLEMRKGQFYLDIKDLRLQNIKSIFLDTGRNPPSRPDTQRMAKYLKDSFKDLGFRVENRKMESYEADALQFRGMSCVVVDTDNGYVEKLSEKDLKRQTETLDKIGQSLVNSLIKIAY